MNSLFRATLLALTLSAAAVADDYPQAPDFTMTSAEGQSVTLSEAADGQTTVVLFWATWCPYCKALMPHLQSLQLELGDDVRILAVTIREDGDPQGFLHENAYDFTLLEDGDEVADEFGVRGTPSVYVIDDQNRIRFDLAKVQRRELPERHREASNSIKAAFRAPYWAAEIRAAVDAVKAERTNR